MYLKQIWNLKQGIFVGPMPYGITWSLMPPMEVLYNPPRPIGIFTPKSQRKKGIITINNIHNVVNINESDKYI